MLIRSDDFITVLFNEIVASKATSGISPAEKFTIAKAYLSPHRDRYGWAGSPPGAVPMRAALGI